VGLNQMNKLQVEEPVLSIQAARLNGRAAC
jgi:hypothetical protein